MFSTKNIQWLGHAGFLIKSSKVIYIDPWQANVVLPADILLITHAHYDHCSLDDIKKIQKKNTVIITSKNCITKKISTDIRIIKPWQTINIEGIQIDAVAAYNIGKSFHPKENNWVGFIVTIGDTRIYHAGDTDLIHEIINLKADIALLPVGGTYTMDAQEAARLVNIMKPRIAIPMHYGTVVGNSSTALEFKKLCDTDVEILKSGKPNE